MTTKERLADEALTLFARCGYSGTSVKSIADAVGIKDSSLYKHFKSKREILDTIVLEMRARIAEMSLQNGLPAVEDMAGAVEAYGAMTPEDVRGLSRRMLRFYLEDSFVSRFWRLANLERYRNEEIYQIYYELFLEDSIRYQTVLFREMIQQGTFVPADPAVMAMSFYAPIFFLLSKYIQEPEREEEALELLDRQVSEFCRVYAAR